MIKMVCLGDSITEGEDIEKGFRWSILTVTFGWQTGRPTPVCF
jgi:hypothetical protein